MREDAPRCLVVGAGMSGLAAGKVLRKSGFHVTILDKGKAVGGRMATRRLRDEQGAVGVCDYGAQHFTVSEKVFRARVSEWKTQNIVEEWCRCFPGALETGTGTTDVFYRGVLSMREIAVRMARGFSLHTANRVTGFDWSDGAWHVATDNGDSYIADILILTPPLPQAKKLLHDSGVQLSQNDRQSLDRIEYDPCIALLAILMGRSSIPAPGGLLVP